MRFSSPPVRPMAARPLKRAKLPCSAHHRASLTLLLRRLSTPALAALRAVHAKKLAVRTLDPTKILVVGKSRCAHMKGCPTRPPPPTIAHRRRLDACPAAIAAPTAGWCCRAPASWMFCPSNRSSRWWRRWRGIRCGLRSYHSSLLASASLFRPSSAHPPLPLDSHSKPI